MKTMKTMETTKAQFEAFKKSFLHWQKELGMMDYKIAFMWEQLDTCYARIKCDHRGKVALVRFNTVVDREDVADGFFNPEGHGKHEALHLFISRLSDLAESRYTTSDAICLAEEGMARVLEKLL
jgi:hypothetical protein